MEVSWVIPKQSPSMSHVTPPHPKGQPDQRIHESTLAGFEHVRIRNVHVAPEYSAYRRSFSAPEQNTLESDQKVQFIFPFEPLSIYFL